MVSEGSGADMLVGLTGMTVLDIEVGAELVVTVETTADRVGCPSCGVVARGHGRRRTRVRDLPIAGRPVQLVWAKRVWRCVEACCETATWSERHDEIVPRATLTERAARELCRRVGEDGDSVAQVARDFGVGWFSAMAAVRTHGRPRVDDPDRIGTVRALGLDETAFLAASGTHPTLFVTGFVDLRRTRLLDVVPGRSGEAVHTWLEARPPGWVAAVEAVALDPHRGYANGLIGHLGDATVVLDHFHAIALANTAINDVRRRTQQGVLGHRGRTGDPLYGIRRLLVRGHEHLTTRQCARIETALNSGDPWGEVGAALLAKELLREVYGALDAAHARRRLTAFYQWAADAEVPELIRLARTISAWQDELLAFHDTAGLSNAATEGLNLLIKKIKRVGHGFRSFDNYRLRLLLHCGVDWNTHRTARLRSHAPRSIA